MTNPPGEKVGEKAAVGANRVHLKLALIMIGALAGTCLLLVGLVHSETVRVSMRDISWEQNRSRESLPIYCFTNHFTDYEEWFLHDKIPSADFSRGGVYFLGASTMKWALKPWDLPAETRPLIHNYAFGGVKHSDEVDFLRYLVEQQDLLKAGPEKTLIVFAQNYRIVHHGRLRPDEGPGEYFRELWTRHGFYDIDSRGTIRRTPGNPLVENWRLESAKMTGFLRELFNIFYAMKRPKRVQTPQIYNEEWSTAMESNWKEMIDSELGYLKVAIEYLKGRKARVAVMLFPVASWDSELPFQAYYHEKLKAICDPEGVPIHDFSKSMKDQDFGDSDHLNPDGVEKFQRGLMPLCLDHLQAAGILPASDHPKDSRPAAR